MKYLRDWLWDRKITAQRAQKILKDPQDRHFLILAALLLSRKNAPKEVFKGYLRPLLFLRHWNRIKRQMRKDRWNNPRIEFWQAVYERLKERYQEKGISFKREVKPARPQDELCKKIADKIRVVRKEEGLTQGALAKKLKVSQQLISRVERGRENISLLTLKSIAEALGARVHLEIRRG